MEKEGAEGIDLIYEGITTSLASLLLKFSASIEGIDLIYEGITTTILMKHIIQCYSEGIDLIYEGITTIVLSSRYAGESTYEGIDLIYEGITTLQCIRSYKEAQGVRKLKGSDLHI